MSDPRTSIGFLGLRLKREVGIVAFLAFVLSLSSLGIQVAHYLQGAQVQMTVGERVNLIRQEHRAVPGVPYLKINARLNFLNTGALGRDAIIARERLHVFFGNPGLARPYEYRWLHHELFVTDGLGAAIPIDIEGAHSFVAPGAGTVSHQTTFVAFPGSPTRAHGPDNGSGNGSAEPAPDSGWITWSEFAGQITRDRYMVLRFIASDATGRDLPAFDCQVMFTDAVIRDLQETGWATALCLAVNGDQVP